METTEEKRATFTPGPWHYTLADETSSGGVYGNEKCVCDIIPKELQVAYDCEEVEIANANARLIAAAPELLEQCKLFEKVLKAIGDMGYRDEIEGLDLVKWLMRTTELREVLAKVEGGEG
jgi:hypothetical protein